MITSRNGESIILDYFRRQCLVSTFDFKIKLYKNNYDPSGNFLAAAFTEADFSGYLAVTKDTWGLPVIQGARVVLPLLTAATFTHNGGGTANSIYGWYMTQTSSGLVVAAHKYAVPRTMASALSTPILVLPSLTLRDENV